MYVKSEESLLFLDYLLSIQISEINIIMPKIVSK